MVELNIIQKIAVWLVPVLLAITVHEVAHGYVARRFGDTTAYMLGRLTLNPFKHIDPVGTVLVPAFMILTIGIAFGWAKPVPVNFSHLRNPKRDMAIVAVAGPAVNLIMAILWAVIAGVAMRLVQAQLSFLEPLVLMGVAGIFINTVLMVLNLIPIPPLDGGRVAVGLLPGKWAWYLSRVEPYGIWILVVMIITGVLGLIIWPSLLFMLKILAPITSIPLFNIFRILNSLGVPFG